MFYGVDVGMKRQRAKIDSRATFVDKTDVDLDAMSAEEVLEYAKFFRDSWKKLIQMMTRIADWYVIYLGKF
jgi:hypothetical protein